MPTGSKPSADGKIWPCLICVLQSSYRVSERLQPIQLAKHTVAYGYGVWVMIVTFERMLTDCLISARVVDLLDPLKHSMCPGVRSATAKELADGPRRVQCMFYYVPRCNFPTTINMARCEILISNHMRRAQILIYNWKIRDITGN